MARVQTGYSGIYVDYEETTDPYFKLNVIECLNTIHRYPVGRLLLKKISESNPHVSREYKVLITAPYKREFIQAGYKIMFGSMVPTNSSDPNWGAMQTRGGTGSGNEPVDHNAAENGSGSAAEVIFNTTIRVTSTGETVYPFLALAHEMIHALHCLNGERIPKTGSTELHEEYFTVGIKGYEGEPITENKIRKEHKIPKRENYP